jgi:penicillin-binding protein 1A
VDAGAGAASLSCRRSRFYRYLLPGRGPAAHYLPEGLPPPHRHHGHSDDNRKIGEFYKERRIVVPLSEMPAKLTEAFIAAEDARFYTHKGIDLLSILRAFFKNLEAGTIVQGGSTITQQVTKSFLLTPERSYRRKIKEAILAYRIDRASPKTKFSIST